MTRSNETWVMNMCQKLEDMCMNVDEFVCKEPVLFVGNQMETVGKSMKNFFSGFVDEFVPTPVVDPVQHVAQVIPSECINSVESSAKSVGEVKENTVESNTNNPNEAPLVPTELCHESSSTALYHSKQITSEISQHLVDEQDSLINKTSDNTTQVKNLSGQKLDNRSEEAGVLYDESLHSDSIEFEYSAWGIENIIDLNLDVDNTIREEPLMDLEEKKTFLNKPSDELKCDSNTTTVHQSSAMESSCTCHENKEENARHIISGGLSSERLCVSLNSSFINSTVEPDTNYCSPTETVDYLSVSCTENKEENARHIISGGLSSERLCVSLNSSFINSTVEPDTNYCSPTETVDYLSVSSDIHSSCGSFTTLAYDSNNEASVSCSGTGSAGGSMVDFEDVKKDAVESCVIVEGGKLSTFPSSSRSKSYKKMIQDAFMSRKRLTKEYKQLAIWYGDIDKELCQPTELSSKQPAEDLPDSEWELL